MYNVAVERGAKGVKAPETLKDDNGTVIISTVQTYGDTTHTFVQRVDYSGPFLPGFKPHPYSEKINQVLPKPPLDVVDHVVGN